MKELLVLTSRFDYSFQNIGIKRLLIKRLLPYLFITLSFLILSACSGSDPTAVEFRLNSEEVIIYRPVSGEEKEDILDLVDRINYYSENVIELDNDEKKFLFFSYVSNYDLDMKPTQIYVSSFQDGDNTIYEIYYLNGSFDSYRREYSDKQSYITCFQNNDFFQDNVCMKEYLEKTDGLYESDALEIYSLSTPRIIAIALGHLIYYADSPHHDIMSRVALAQTYLIHPGFRRAVADIDRVNAYSLYEEDFTLSWFLEYCSPSLSNCQRIVNNRSTYEIDLKNKTIIFDGDDYPNLPPFGLIDENFNDYFNIYNKNFFEDAYVVNGVFSNEKYDELKGDFSGNKGLENLRNYIFHDERE